MQRGRHHRDRQRGQREHQRRNRHRCRTVPEVSKGGFLHGWSRVKGRPQALRQLRSRREDTRTDRDAGGGWRDRG
jgi:hypothetical protein